MKKIHFETINSTNTYAKQLIETSINEGTFNNFENTLITANSQSEGRGRLGRSFFSPANTGIYMSIIYKPKNDNEILNPSFLTSSAAVSVCKILDSTFNINTQIKWVNDIYLNNKKICGILTEGVLFNGKIGAAIVGIGINLNTKDFPEEIRNKAGSINSTINIDRQKLAQTIATECISTFSSTDNFEQILKQYKNRSLILGKKITVHPIIDDNSKDFRATAIDITSDAKLVIQLSDKSTKILDSGEISIIL